jgi:ABC-type multidrug transport system fused ATPase/permease subunit
MTARKSFLTETSRNVLELLLVAAVGPLAVVYLYSDGDGLLAMLATFGMAAYRALPALNRIMVSAQSAKFGTASLETIHEILDAERPPSGDAAALGPAPARTPAPAGAAQALGLRFDGFRLRNGRSVLDGCDVRVEPGQVCVIWGPSGSGKSTIVETLVDGGTGIEVRYGSRLLPHGLSELAGQVGVTAQSPLVLPATLRENLTLGLPDGDFDAAAAASLLDRDPRSVLDVAGIGERLDTPIHRHAVSGGQAQRISLLRALDPAHDVVVLDEPTSALDRTLAAALRERIETSRDGRVFVVVTHDPDLKQLADLVVDVS